VNGIRETEAMADRLKAVVAVLGIVVLVIVAQKVVVQKVAGLETAGLVIEARKDVGLIDVAVANADPRGGPTASAGRMVRVPIAVLKVAVPKVTVGRTLAVPKVVVKVVADQRGPVARQVPNDWLTTQWSSTRMAMAS
jgi:hypothetical protein